MNILVIMKRFGVNKDMVIRNFGRQIRLFEPLAKKHNVDFLCPDYKKHERRTLRKNGIDYYIRPYSMLGHLSFLKELDSLVRKNHYDVIFGTSDPIFGIIGHYAAKRHNIKHVYDMQDEYSWYGSYKIPFIRLLDRKAIRDSDIVLTVSRSLKGHVEKFRKKSVYVIENGINSGDFRGVSKRKARDSLRLPEGKLIVYLGEISRLKGGDVLLKAFREVRKSVPDAWLLLSGSVADNIDVRQPNVIYEGYPERGQVTMALNAADVAVIPNRKSTFSLYCFPYKLAEYMAAGIPIVSTDLGDASLILKKYPNSLCRPDDAHDMADKIIKSLK